MPKIHVNQEDVIERIEKAKNNPEVPKLYFNGFSIVFNATDATLLLEKMGAPVALFNMSYTTAKSLTNKLNDSMSKFENVVKQKILDIDEVIEHIQENNKNHEKQ